MQGFGPPKHPERSHNRRGRKLKHTDGQTDGRYQTYYLPSFAVDKDGQITPDSVTYPWALRYSKLLHHNNKRSLFPTFDDLVTHCSCSTAFEYIRALHCTCTSAIDSSHPCQIQVVLGDLLATGKQGTNLWCHDTRGCHISDWLWAPEGVKALVLIYMDTLEVYQVLLLWETSVFKGHCPLKVNDILVNRSCRHH